MENAHGQSTSLPRIPPCLPRLPALANTCTQACARSDPLPATLCTTWTTRAPTPPICAAPVSTETSTTSPQASHAPNHGCPRLPAPAKPARYLPATTRALGSTSNNFARDLDHPRTHAPPVCVGPVRAVRANTCALLASNDARSDPLQATCARPWPPAHPRATIMRWASDNGEQHDQSASLPRSPPCLPDSPHWQTHARYLPATTRALGSTSSKLRATWTTHAPTRHQYALRQ